MPDDDYGPWDDGLDAAFAQLDRNRALEGQRIGENIVAQLDRRPSTEDVLVRAFRRIEAGTYTEPVHDPLDSAAGTCDGQLDDFGRCASRFHTPGCMNVVESSAATSDAAGATAWRNVLLGYTPPPEALGLAQEQPGDGTDVWADLLEPPGGPFSQSELHARMRAVLDDEPGSGAQPVPGRQLPPVGGLRSVLGL